MSPVARSVALVAVALLLAASSSPFSTNAAPVFPGFALNSRGDIVSVERDSSCANAPQSCSSSSVSDTCCTNSPGGLLLQVQFWDTNPVTGPSDSWTIHGLWPDNCDGTYGSSCDPSRKYSNITQILDAAGQSDLVKYMNTYWVSNDESPEAFWEHEWSTHGTCVSTLDPSCYTNYQPQEEVVQFFNTTVSLFQSLPTHTWLADAGVTPSDSTTYSLQQLNDAVSKNTGHAASWQCKSNTLYQVQYYYNTVGQSNNVGAFVPVDPISSDTNCPSSGIQYPTKTGGSSGGNGGR